MVIVALLSGIGPALRTSASAPIDALKEQGRGNSGDVRMSVASSLVIAQVALSVTLVVAAGLFVRTFVALATRDLGFERDRALVVNLNAQRASVDPAQRLQLFERARDSVRALPGITDVALSIVTPAGGLGMLRNITVSDGTAVPATMLGGIANSSGNTISPRWFGTMGIPLIAGRDFTNSDRTGSPLVAIVNQALARKFLNGQSPVGHTITDNPPFGAPQEIVGLVGDAV